MKSLDTLQNEYAAGKITFSDYTREINNIIKNDAAKMSEVFYRMAKVIENGNK